MVLAAAAAAAAAIVERTGFRSPLSCLSSLVFCWWSVVVSAVSSTAVAGALPVAHQEGMLLRFLCCCCCFSFEACHDVGLLVGSCAVDVDAEEASSVSKPAFAVASCNCRCPKGCRRMYTFVASLLRELRYLSIHHQNNMYSILLLIVLPAPATSRLVDRPALQSRYRVWLEYKALAYSTVLAQCRIHP